MKYILKYIIIIILPVVWALASEFGGRIESGIITDTMLGEISGIVAGRANPGIFWVHNDSGDEPRIFAIDKNAVLKGELAITGAKNFDYEDISTGPGPVSGINYIYIGDFGDNDAVRNHITVYRIPEPAIDSFGKTPFKGNSVKADAINLKYPDGARDAEAMFADPASGDIYIISKREKNARVYRAAFPQTLKDTIVLEYLLELPFGSMGIPNNGVTGADISPDGSEILIKTYMTVYYFKRNKGESIPDALYKQPKTLKYTIEPQGEGICWDAEGAGFYTISEFGTAAETYLYFYPRLPSEVKKNTGQEEILISQTNQEIVISPQLSLHTLNISIYDINGRLYYKNSFSGDICPIHKSILLKGIYIVLIDTGISKLFKVISIF